MVWDAGGVSHMGMKGEERTAELVELVVGQTESLCVRNTGGQSLDTNSSPT